MRRFPEENIIFVETAEIVSEGAEANELREEMDEGRERDGAMEERSEERRFDGSDGRTG